jgi:uncharacterized protein YbcI
MAESAERAQGAISSAISVGAVRLLGEYTGRGPTRARTTIDRDIVMILFAETLTKAEKKLAGNGDGDIVLQMRHRIQHAMRDDLIALVETQLERKVIAFMSSNHIDPDLAVEVFVLQPATTGNTQLDPEAA